MDVRKLMLLAGALLFAGVAAVFARSMFAANTPAKAAVAPVVQAGTEVLVAAKPLPVGTIITADQLSFRPWPKDLIDGAYYVKGTADPGALAGKVVRFPVTVGQPVTQGSLVGPGERGFLAAALGPGMRAVTVSVSDTSGVAGFVFPGDRVDMVLTQEVTGEGRALKAAETVVRDLRVLAADQSTDNANKEAKVSRTVTVEATPKIAEKIAVAQAVGTLSLSLRSIAETPDQLAALEEGKLKDVAHAPSDADPSVTTGGEVSRFQRTTPPPQQSAGGGGGASPSPAAAGPAKPKAAPRPDFGVRVSRGSVTTNTTTDAPAAPPMTAAMAAGTMG